MPISFRDPAGKLLFVDDEVFRVINNSGNEDFTRATNSPILRNFIDSARLATFFPLDDRRKGPLLEKLGNRIDQDAVAQVVKHDQIIFRSYPYEWPAEMLHSAAILTLDLAQQLQTEGMGLKDATPYNVLFRGPNPVFVDWLSFEGRNPQNPIWLAQSQFIRTFCLPLMASKHFGMELSWVFRVNRDGLEPESVYKMCGLRQKFIEPFLTLVTIPKLLGSKSKKDTSIYQERLLNNEEKAGFILNQQFNQLRHVLRKVDPEKDRSSDWAEYVGDKKHFTDKYFQQKQAFIERFFAEHETAAVLDVGCNTGSFSRIAAKAGASVVAIDTDSAVVGKVWHMALKEKLDILPMVVDIARPSPATGWRNRENVSFIDRVKGRVDVVLMLAIVHHLIVTERIPVGEIIELMAEITSRFLIIEFVPSNDPMFRRIARGRDHLFTELNEETFTRACQKHFKILQTEKLADSGRRIYLLEK